MVVHDIMVHNSKVCIKTKSKQNHTVAFVTSRHEALLYTVSDQETAFCCAFNRVEFCC